MEEEQQVVELSRGKRGPVFSLHVLPKAQALAGKPVVGVVALGGASVRLPAADNAAHGP